jgi:hypothetical protein
MKFKPRLRYGSFIETDRKRAAVLRAQKRERDRLPLFAADIARAQSTVDEIMLNRALAWAPSRPPPDTTPGNLTVGNGNSHEREQ